MKNWLTRAWKWWEKHVDSPIWDILAFLRAPILLAGLAVTILWGLKANEHRQTVIMGGLTAILAFITLIYTHLMKVQAEASRRMAEGMERARLASVHPRLIIASLSQLKSGLGVQWLAPAPKLALPQISIKNVGPGLAVNWSLSLRTGGQDAKRWEFPHLGFGTESPTPLEVDKDKQKAINSLVLSCEDVFGYEHWTSYDLNFVSENRYEVGTNVRMCCKRNSSGQGEPS